MTRASLIGFSTAIFATVVALVRAAAWGTYSGHPLTGALAGALALAAMRLAGLRRLAPDTARSAGARRLPVEAADVVLGPTRRARRA